jgi:hypothetical protein
VGQLDPAGPYLFSLGARPAQMPKGGKYPGPFHVYPAMLWTFVP